MPEYTTDTEQLAALAAVLIHHYAERAEAVAETQALAAIATDPAAAESWTRVAATIRAMTAVVQAIAP